MVQALQAFLFQLVSFLAFGVLFLLFVIGFNYAALSGLIARTSWRTRTHIKLNYRCNYWFCLQYSFFNLYFLLWGIWAGIQILRGKSYQYPILGKVVIRYTSRKPFIVKGNLPPKIHNRQRVNILLRVWDIS